MVVDMFVVSSLVTLVMGLIGLIGSGIRQVIDLEDGEADEVNLSVKIEFHRMDEWNEAQENMHWKALAWLITDRSKRQTKGQFRMVPYVPEHDNDSDSEEEDNNEYYKIDIPRFHILPLNDRELEIEFNSLKFICQFDHSNSNAPPSGGDDKKNDRAPDPLINREPPILIRRVDGEVATLESMQTTLNEISELYAKNQAAKKRRSRYERPADCSWWRWVQNLRSSRGLSSVALDVTQETLLLKDLETFSSDKDFYKRMGLPYRRGYLFSGKPGTGKTSLINAISATYNRDLYYINLQDIKTDNELQSAFASVPRNSIIVFEDIDAQSAEVHTRERRFALKKVDKMRALKEKEMEIKRKKREAAEEKLLEVEKAEVTADAAEDGDAEKKPKKKLNLMEIYKDDDDDMFDSMLDSGFGMMGDYGGSSMIGPSLPSGGGFGSGFGSGGGFGGMDFGDLKLGKGSLFSGFTLSMLLNCLDGHMLEPNVIIIMTTNHPEVLDPALIRPGRIDLHLSLGYCTRYQLNRMYQSVMNDTEATLDFVSNPVPEQVIAPCDALRLMILYRSNPSIIPVRLMERASELLNGKPLTTGIQAGEAAMTPEPEKIKLIDLSISSDSAVGSDEGSENGVDSEIRSRKVFTAEVV
ncbi:mitochondrial chaperone [Physocladia obscura]|uniref:Mitochondrial chaperone n=1 Tax=Physocladia obscura TaxID=109957 RepID=A0AAD5TAW2_9FUNG|nr:mitochondrial chaperone [Physocladia obscura]